MEVWPENIKWLHQFEEISCVKDGHESKYKVEEFGYFDGDERAIKKIKRFFDTNSPRTLNMVDIILIDIAAPIEYTLKRGIRDIAKSDQLNQLRRKKVVFYITKVLARIYNHPNYRNSKELISKVVTDLLVLITELYTENLPDKNDAVKMTTFFKAKEFLSSITLKIWSICLYEEGVALMENQTIPYLRQLAMMDILDKNWKYAGGWEDVLKLLEDKHGKMLRLPTDKALSESTEMSRKARNSIRCQVMALSGLVPANVPDRQKIVKDIVRDFAPQMFCYYPKCSAYMCSEVETAEKPHRLRCYRCHYFHWCSSACQIYSETVACHHESYCENCPDAKKRQCRNEMEEHLGIEYRGESDDDDEIVKCHACGLKKKYSKSMQRCSSCKAVHYCSQACQVWDWSKGEHRSKCNNQDF